MEDNETSTSLPICYLFSFSFIFSGHGYQLIFLVRISISNVSSQTPVFQRACHRSCPYDTHAELEFFSLVIYLVLLYVKTWNELSDDYYSFEITRRHIYRRAVLCFFTALDTGELLMNGMLNLPKYCSHNHLKKF